jgi:hypothetical protein
MAFKDFIKRDVVTPVAIFTVSKDANNATISEIMNVFDAVVEEDHSSNVRISQHPIEDGSTIADHAYVEPLKLVLQGFKSNHPISLLSSDNLRNLGTSFATGGLENNFLYPQGWRFKENSSSTIRAPIVGKVSVASAAQLGTGYLNQSVSQAQAVGQEPVVPSNLAQRAYEELYQRQVNRIPLSVATGLRIYSNMLITSMDTTRNAKNAHSLVTRVTLEEIRIVKTAKKNVYGFMTRQQPTGDNAEIGSCKDGVSSTVDQGKKTEKPYGNLPDILNSNDTILLKSKNLFLEAWDLTAK